MLLASVKIMPLALHIMLDHVFHGRVLAIQIRVLRLLRCFCDEVMLPQHFLRLLNLARLDCCGHVRGARHKLRVASLARLAPQLVGD